MQFVIWGGAAVTLIGFLGICWSMFAVAAARRAKLDDDAMRERLRKVVPVNLGALGLSILGLMAVVIGILLG